ncbi:hypothetical protein [Burkholderia ambifaria]|jgi:hypothetical protein|uniref:hypothetical protein n=1 Tax=Burkholderia ambifaria TaxID=152480 RepID=UPI001B8F5571|nr:hypothetical protein [Burkholderia ambifaria]MBR8177958.1 hypothetical protein [Burkholderia ambifaria]
MQRHHPSETSGQLAFVEGEHFANISPSGWRAALHDSAAQREVLSRFAAFCQRIRGLDRHHVLSLTGLYTLIGSASALQRDAAYTEVAELEFLQAITLTGNDCNPLQLEPAEVSQFWRELSTQCYVASQGDNNDAAALSDLARIHAAYYRNPYGDKFFDRMIVSITKEYDDRYIRDGSLARSGLALIALRREIRQRFDEFMKSGRVALTSSRRKVLELLRRLTPDMTDDRFNVTFNSLKIDSLRQVAYQANEDNAVENMFVLDKKWIESQELEGIPMTAVLGRLSQFQATVNNIDPRVLASANPVWSAPVVEHRDGYALYSPVTLTSFPFRCLLSLLDGDAQAKSRLEKIRGWFVEQEGKRLLEKAFPSAQVVLGGFWQRTPDERVETDLLVLSANRLFILEGKGALIPDRVRFGAPDATIQFLKRIWGKATGQGAALANHLEAATGPVTITDKKGRVAMTLNPDSIRSISRFGISAEQVGPLMNSPEMLRQAGVLNETTLAAPCVILSELEQVLGYAQDELHKLHYLLRRSQFAETHQIIGDEMDIYTTYIQYGLSELPDTDRKLMLLGASYSLDDYRTDDGKIRLPSDSVLRCSPYFQRVLREAKDRQSPAYLEVGLRLLDMPYRQQQQLERQMERLFNKRPKASDWPIAMTAVDVPGERSALAIVLIDNRTSLEERRSVGMNVASTAREQLKADHVTCIVRLWNSKNSYDALYVLGQTLMSKRNDRRPPDDVLVQPPPPPVGNTHSGS